MFSFDAKRLVCALGSCTKCHNKNISTLKKIQNSVIISDDDVENEYETCCDWNDGMDARDLCLYYALHGLIFLVKCSEVLVSKYISGKTDNFTKVTFTDNYYVVNE